MNEKNELVTVIEHDITLEHCCVIRSGREAIFVVAKLNNDNVVLGCKGDKGIY